MECTKEFTLTIETGLQFTWAAPTLNPGTGGSASFSPATGVSGNTAVMAISIPNASDQSSVDSSGQLTLNTTAVVPCNMHLVITSVGVLPDPFIAWQLQMFDFLFGGILFEDQTTQGISGTVDIPFNLPNTFGANDQVDWTMQAQVQCNPALGGSISVVATFSVL